MPPKAYIGSSNKDGTGSAQNLNATNGTSVFARYENDDWWNGEYYYQDDNVDIYCNQEMVNHGHDDFEAKVISQWNAAGCKEIKMGGVFSSVGISNFVDFDMSVGQFDYFGSVYIENAKRGNLDIGAGSAWDPWDVMETKIQPHSNGDSWSNMFTVVSTEITDRLTFTSTLSDGTVDPTGKWTEFNVSLGSSDDSFYYDLVLPANDSRSRFVDGGENGEFLSEFDILDLDTLYLYRDTADIEFINFEQISSNGSSISLDSTALSNNASKDVGLILNNTIANFSEDIDVLSIHTLSEETEQYLETQHIEQTSYWKVIVTDGNSEYLLIVDNIESLLTA